MSLFARFRAPPAPVAAGFGVLMVCMGNICRSPMAEGVLRGKLDGAGLGRRVQVASAGTHGLHGGAPPDPRAVAAARQRGYDLSGVRSRRVTDADFERYALLLAMDVDNLTGLESRCPPHRRERVRLLLEMAPRPDGVLEIPDPYYGPAQGFETVLDMIEAACDALVVDLADRLEARDV